MADGDPIKVKTNKDLSPDDLEAEIAATAAALGGKGPKDQPKADISPPKPEPKPEPKTEDEQKPDPEEHKVAVSIKKRNLIKEPAGKPEPKKEEATVPVHTAKTVEPVKPQSPKVESASAEVKAEPEPKPEPSPEPDPAPKPEPKTESTPVSQDPVKTDSQESKKVYDTDQYHLPIKPSRHHRQSQVPMLIQLLVLVLLIGVGALLAYINSWFNFGV